MASRFLYLARHGEAPEGGSLSDAGEEQARRTGERLKNLPVTQIHHSPPATRRADGPAGQQLYGYGT
ncbi:MAG: histidine phosphatase family protein [Streptosporangiaceae bacterium]